jgi:hypothetical protein
VPGYDRLSLRDTALSAEMSKLQVKAGRLAYSRGRRFSVEDAYGAALNDKCDQPLEQHEEPIGETDQEVNVHPRPEEPGH